MCFFLAKVNSKTSWLCIRLHCKKSYKFSLFYSVVPSHDNSTGNSCTYFTLFGGPRLLVKGTGEIPYSNSISSVRMVFSRVLTSHRWGQNSIPGRDYIVSPGTFSEDNLAKALMIQYFRNKLSALTSHTHQCIVGFSSNTFRIILLHRTRWNILINHMKGFFTHSRLWT